MLKLLQDEKIKDNFVLHIVQQSSDWQWLVDHIEKEYQYTNYESWDDYTKIFEGTVLEPVKIFVRILTNIDNKSITLDFKRREIQQMWYIAEFINNNASWKATVKKVNIDMLKIILLSIYITKLMNKANNTNFDIYYNLLVNTNLFQIYDLSLIEKNKDDIFKYLNTIKLKNINVLKETLLSNINHVVKEYNNQLLYSITDKSLSIDLFRFKTLPISNNLSWQENTIINILNTKFVESLLIPEINYSENYPNLGGWDESIVKLLKKYFGLNNKVANFVIESTYYLRKRKDGQTEENRKYIPSAEVISLHLHLLVNAIKQKESNKNLIRTSSLYLLSCLFKDRATGVIRNNSNYKYIVQWIQSPKNVSFEKKLQRMGFPISKQNQLQLEKADKEALENLKNVTTIFGFCRYLEQKKLVNIITEKQLENIKNKFWTLLKDENINSIDISSLFIDYAKFLSNAFSNKRLNKSLLNSEIIKIQLIWENDIYSQSIDRMTEKTFEIAISNKEISNFRKLFIKDPRAVANQLLPVDEYSIFRQLDSNSEHPMLSLIPRTWIEKTFPQTKKSIELKHHKVEKFFIEYIDKIKSKYCGLFLNNMETKSDLLNLFYYYGISLSNIAFLDKKQMYNKVSSSCKYSLDSYNEKTTLGLVTQFFPILEMKIRQVASYCGISPFKNNSFDDVGVKYNDPSTLLTKIISIIYSENKDLISSQGFLFVYLTMYDSNFKNIRNSLIHARNFLKGEDLELALRCTLLSISIMDNYLNKIDKR